jgi:vancomycin resistance protein YoaR
VSRAEAAAAAFIVALLTLCGAVFFCAGLLSGDRIAHGVSIGGVDVSGRTREEALGLFRGREALSGDLLEITVDGRARMVSAQDADARRDVPETVDRAWSLGRAGGPLERLSTIFSLRADPRGFEFHTVFDDDAIREIAEGIGRETAKPPRNAALRFLPLTDGVFAYDREAKGRGIDASALYERMKEALEGGGPASISVNSSPVRPEVTEESLRAATQPIGTFTTALAADDDRSGNILLAAEALNGAVIWPGEEFSFNGRTGERTAEKGYADAAAISGGQLTDETGGGVCQAATTVYNAALLSGLAVTERHAHSRPMAYVDAGRDATVDYASGKDLRLRNGSNSPVYLIVRVDGARGLLTACFYGAPPAEEIRISEEDYRVIMPERPEEFAAPEKPIGWSRTLTEARPGCRVTIYRIFTKGAETRRELVSEDYYPPQRGKIEIGTGAPEGENK